MAYALTAWMVLGVQDFQSLKCHMGVDGCG
jgi:hypothetical protein